MSDLKANSSSFKEAVCIEAQRIYDSCSDKDYQPYILKNTFKV